MIIGLFKWRCLLCCYFPLSQTDFYWTFRVYLRIFSCASGRISRFSTFVIDFFYTRNDLCLTIDNLFMSHNSMSQIMYLFSLLLKYFIHFFTIIECRNINLFFHQKINVIIDGKWWLSLLRMNIFVLLSNNRLLADDFWLIKRHIRCCLIGSFWW